MPKRKPSKAAEPAAINVELVTTKARKKSPPRSAFKPGNPHRFQPGQSGNPGGAPKEHKLLSRTLRTLLSDRAPAVVTRTLSMPPTSSWAQCIAQRLAFAAVGGDLEAVRLIGTFTEGVGPRGGLDLSALDDMARRDPASVPPIFEVVFVESDGDGRPRQTTIDGEAPALPATAALQAKN